MRLHRLIVALTVLVALGIAGYGAHIYAAGRANGGQNDPPIAQEFTLRTGIVEGRLVFVGVGGDIDGVANPTLSVPAGAGVAVTLINGDGMPHDFVAPELGVKSATVSTQGGATRVVFAPRPNPVGTYTYFCSIAGHRQAGMAGQIIVH
jgi:nitrite reductase (NO-forming)